MSFSDALECLKEGRAIARSRWKGSYRLSIEENELTGVEYIHTTAQGTSNHYIPNQSDILADDWEMVA